MKLRNFSLGLLISMLGLAVPSVLAGDWTLECDTSAGVCCTVNQKTGAIGDCVGNVPK